MTPRFTILLAAIFLIGCGRSEPSPSQEQPAAEEVPATQAAATRATESILNIDGQAVTFPPAILRLSPADKGLLAHLYSGETPSTQPAGDSVNAYALEMVLPDTDDPADLSQAAWTYKSPFNDRRETPFGIFLVSQQKMLQPKEVQVHFTGAIPQVTVILKGTFLMFDTTDATPPRQVTVEGELPAMAEKN